MTLDQLGLVLKHLSEQLPGSYKCLLKYIYLVYYSTHAHIAFVIAKRTFDDEELKSGTPNLIIIPSGIYI